MLLLRSTPYVEAHIEEAPVMEEEDSPSMKELAK